MSNDKVYERLTLCNRCDDFVEGKKFYITENRDNKLYCKECYEEEIIKMTLCFHLDLLMNYWKEDKIPHSIFKKKVSEIMKLKYDDIRGPDKYN
jgi:hypothetical protein